MFGRDAAGLQSHCKTSMTGLPFVAFVHLVAKYIGFLPRAEEEPGMLWLMSAEFLCVSLSSLRLNNIFQPQRSRRPRRKKAPGEKEIETNQYHEVHEDY